MTPEQLHHRLSTLGGTASASAPPGPFPAPGEDRVAAVLIALLATEPDCPVILTRRSADMRHHAGEISLPGGLLEPEDNTDVVRAALREADEELGLSPSAVRVHTVLPALRNSSGVRVYPVLGTLTQRPVWRLQPAEVSEVLEVPLSFFLTEQHYLPRHRYYRGELRDTLVMDYGGHAIWGLTARIMRELRQALQPA
ncbi:NUDIX hydrolase [Alcanivorax sp. S71-1-4]|uniref:NUDIX hydrolase n=1 Tax=Alcanivorax sp. S71-1-4 TaxID=1177159 RepID=UPI001358ECB0|nr:CoA pyrophosphatase [Alcanivorax sp. S71-1-4]KAF0807551.1 NUDIX hydrolase [Alcanivorax sp. S71-1-4]